MCAQNRLIRANFVKYNVPLLIFILNHLLKAAKAKIDSDQDTIEIIIHYHDIDKYVNFEAVKRVYVTTVSDIILETH